MGQIFSLFLKDDMQLYNDILLVRTLYLVPFARDSVSKISFCDLDFSGSPKVKIFQLFVEPKWDFTLAFC